MRIAVVVAALVAPLAVLLSGAPLPLPPGYHDFADTRAWLGIPNFMDVASNAVLLAAGLYGLARCATADPVSRRSWSVFFAAASLAAVASAYYHWAPRVHTIAWDQLAIAVSCAGLIVAVATEHLGAALQRVALIPMLVAAGLSVAVAVYAGDLRFYAWVQGGALLGVALLPLLFEGAFSHRRYIGYGLALYALAKLCETLDVAIFGWTGAIVSGHTLKHLFAAAAVAMLARMLGLRADATGSGLSR